ncbi:MAG: TonB-dependent receptor [Thiohalomonadaceae bacterium]
MNRAVCARLAPVLAFIFSAPLAAQGSVTSNAFNPAMSLILDGRFATFDNNPEAYELPGFMLGGEAGLGAEGFVLGHSELVLSANIDDQYYGQFTAAVADHAGETEVELEEAFIQTLGLGGGFTVKAGRFFSGIGYLNEQHMHVWDFADAPLVYRGLFGDQLRDDGVQLRWLAPTNLFVELGAEALRGGRFPAGGAANEGAGAFAAFAKVGGDVGVSHSWRIGLSHWRAEVEDREAGGHSHGHGDEESASFTGDSAVTGVDFVWKWAPGGNAGERNFKFQAEYFQRDEEGDVTVVAHGNPPEQGRYDGTQSGWYAQAVYQFTPRWRAGLRYDVLDADNDVDDAHVAEHAGLDPEGHTPMRWSVMLDFANSEYSRLRLQYNRDESYEAADNQVVLQYTMSLGAHGAHPF